MSDATIRYGPLTGAAAAAVASAAAALCCVGPLALTLLGVNGMILAAGLRPFRWYLLLASAGLLALAFWSMYRPNQQACPLRVQRVMRVLLWLSAATWIAALILQFVGSLGTL